MARCTSNSPLFVYHGINQTILFAWIVLLQAVVRETDGGRKSKGKIKKCVREREREGD